MAEITAKLVSELREASGAGMMDCKKALVEASGDIEQAKTILRKKGLAAASKRAGKVASEGRVVAKVSADRRRAVLIEINSETDFVARNDEFRAFGDTLAGQVLEAPEFSDRASDDAASLLDAKYAADRALTVREATSALVAKIGENIQPRRFVRLDAPANGRISTYVHGEGKIGVAVELRGDAAAVDSDAARELGADLAMHIAAADPRCLSRADVDPVLVAREREIASEQARQSGKPDNVVQRIVDGRMDKFYAEIVLLEQAFVKNPDLSIEKHVAACAKAAGGALELVRFRRYRLGEGIEKPVTDFAAEVAAATGGKA